MGKIPSGAPRELAPEGTHNAVLFEIIDMGTQPSNNPNFGEKRKVNLGFELVDEKTKDGKAMVVYKQYTFSSSAKANLMKDLKAWLGVKTADYDMDNALTKGALVTIEHSETDKGTFANIVNITAPPKGLKIKKHTEKVRSLYLDDTFDKEVFDGLHEWMRTKIAGSPEYAEIVTAQTKKKAPAKSAGKGKKK